MVPGVQNRPFHFFTSTSSSWTLLDSKLTIPRIDTKFSLLFIGFVPLIMCKLQWFPRQKSTRLWWIIQKQIYMYWTYYGKICSKKLKNTIFIAIIWSLTIVVTCTYETRNVSRQKLQFYKKGRNRPFLDRIGWWDRRVLSSAQKFQK